MELDLLRPEQVASVDVLGTRAGHDIRVTPRSSGAVATLQLSSGYLQFRSIAAHVTGIGERELAM
jgi:hypothetical protein